MDKMDKLFKRTAKSWLDCEEDPVYFIENFCKIVDQSNGDLIPFILWPDQITQIRIWQQHHNSITLKSRQIGISLLRGGFNLHGIMFRNYYQSMIVSKKEDDANDYVSDVKIMHENLPDLFKELNPVVNETKSKIELKNGARLKAEASSPQAGRSKTLNDFTLDEAAFMPDAKSIWTAARPTIEKAKGNAAIISTANGFDKFFQPKWKAAENKRVSMHPNFISWQGDPNRTQEWYDGMLYEAIEEGEECEHLFRQEYPCTAEEAFMMTGNSVFSPKLLQSLMNDIQKTNPKFTKGYFNYKNQFQEDERGDLKIYEFPKEGADYVAGADIAEGLEKGDNSCAVIYKRKGHQKDHIQVAEFAGKMDTDKFGRFLYYLGRWYKNALIGPEMNSYGESVMNILAKEMHYPRIYRQYRFDERSNKKIRKLGWRTTVTTKPVMIDSLKAMLRERKMIIKSLEAVGEMRTFVRKDAFSTSKMGADGKNYDDRVIAHAICAVMLMERPPDPPHRRKTIPNYRTRILTPKRHNYNVQKLFS